MTAFWTSLIFVVLAEMGDKTQLLAMAFACRFRWQTVMWGVFVATAANHLLAAAFGNYLAVTVSMDYIKTAAAASFIIFGIWTIRGDTLHGEDKRFSFSPFWTVTTAFFIAEMGDKTQLATIALAVKYNSVLRVWIGTTLGMLVSNAAGIFAGAVMGKSVREGFIKWFAALTFIAFGVFGLYETLPENSRYHIIGGVFLLVMISYWVLYRNRAKTGKAPLCGEEKFRD
ncbi:MAG: TMEM165/GDT1 family protein [Nitrospiraceae bacterium]|nr:MAG: TMEM165/GDT1 family protein [Nitrospiraceae bacterium]